MELQQKTLAIIGLGYVGLPLAVEFARQGFNVFGFDVDESKTSLLVDCNLRYPNQHKAFGVEPRTGGLIDFLEHPSRGIASIMYHTGVPRLRLIPAGRSRENSEPVYSGRLPLSPMPAQSRATTRKRLTKNGATKLHQRACARKP